MAVSQVRTRPLALLQAARYPQAYVWFVFISSLDVMLTWIILHLGGREVNFLANYVLQRWELIGVVVYKFALVSLIVCICEVVGHSRPQTGRALARFAVLITLLPVIIALTHIAAVRGNLDPDRQVAFSGSDDPLWTTDQ